MVSKKESKLINHCAKADLQRITHLNINGSIRKNIIIRKRLQVTRYFIINRDVC